MSKLIVSLVVVFTFVVSSVGKEQPETIEALQVQVIVFSGRPDPIFTVTDPVAIREIGATLKSLPPHPTLGQSASLTPPGRLGYRGMLVHNVSTVDSDIARFTVFRTAVEIVRKGTESKDFRLDSGGELEKRLIRIAEEKKILSRGVLEHVRGSK